MDFWIAVVALTTVGCGTGIVITFIDKAFGGRARAKEQELRLKQQQLEMVEERARHLEAQLIEARRNNEHLQKQVEWHGKLLETQDQLLRRLSPPESDGQRSLPEQAAAR